MARTFQNQATLTYGENTVVSNITSGTIEDAVTLSKTALTPTYDRDCPITYIINLRNDTDTLLGGLTVTDNLGAYTQGAETRYPLTYVPSSTRQYRDGLEVAPPTTAGGPPLVFSDVSVNPGGNTVIIYQARANAYAPYAQGSTITNTATLTGGECISAEDSETVTVVSEPIITITKNLCPTSLNRCDAVRYTFTLENYGNTPLVATDGAIFSDTFTPVLCNLVATFNGTVWTDDVEYTYDEASGLFRTNDTYITVPAATVTQNPDTGEFAIVPGVSTLVVAGNICCCQ